MHEDFCKNCGIDLRIHNPFRTDQVSVGWANWLKDSEKWDASAGITYMCPGCSNDLVAGSDFAKEIE